MKKGDILVTGAGADIGGYSCELERTMILGKPTKKQRRYFEVMIKAQEQGLRALRPGAMCSSVDKTTQKVFRKAGFSSKAVVEGLVKDLRGRNTDVVIMVCDIGSQYDF